MRAMAIHPTAIINPQAELDPSVEVGPHAIIDAHVKIGAGTRIWANAYITGHTEIGRDNQIHMGAIIGHEPQDLRFKRDTRSYLRIGDRNILREYCTVHRGTEPESATVLGNDCFLMANVHIGHNCELGDRVIIANASMLGGYVQVADRAFISGGVAIHQFLHIGRLVMISGNSRVSMDVPPFVMLAERNEVHGLNLVGLKRAQIKGTALKEIKQVYRLFYRSDLNRVQAIEEASQLGRFTSPEAKEFVTFIQTSPNGVATQVNGRGQRAQEHESET